MPESILDGRTDPWVNDFKDIVIGVRYLFVAYKSREDYEEIIASKVYKHLKGLAKYHLSLLKDHNLQLVA